MRKLIIIIALALVSCEDRRCDDRREEIEVYYYDLIDRAIGSGNFLQAELLTEEMERALREACE